MTFMLTMTVNSMVWHCFQKSPKWHIAGAFGKNEWKYVMSFYVYVLKWGIVWAEMDVAYVYSWGHLWLNRSKMSLTKRNVWNVYVSLWSSMETKNRRSNSCFTVLILLYIKLNIYMLSDETGPNFENENQWLSIVVSSLNKKKSEQKHISTLSEV